MLLANKVFKSGGSEDVREWLHDAASIARFLLLYGKIYPISLLQIATCPGFFMKRSKKNRIGQIISRDILAVIVAGRLIIAKLRAIITHPVVKRNLRDVRLFLSGTDVPPSQGGVETMRILLITLDDDAKKIQDLLSISGLWRNQGYEVIALTTNEQGLDPFTYDNGVAILRRGGIFSIHVFMLLYWFSRFRNNVTAVVVFDRRLTFVTRLFSRIPMVSVWDKQDSSRINLRSIIDTFRRRGIDRYTVNPYTNTAMT